jgi:hypothetical protein
LWRLSDGIKARRCLQAPMPPGATIPW